MSDHRIVIPFLGAAAMAGWGFFVGGLISHGNSPTDADVRAYMRATGGERFTPISPFQAAVDEWRASHPDIPRTIEFPEIATNPVLCDFTFHSVLRGEKRFWTWGYPRVQAITTTGTPWAVTDNSMGGVLSCMSGGVYTVIPTMIHAASGGRP